MAALQSTQFIHFALPPSKPSFRNRNALWVTKSSRSNLLLNASYSQKAYTAAATFPREGCQDGAGQNMTARAEEHKRVLADSNNESGDNFPSLQELCRATLRPKISTEASKTASTPHLEDIAHYGAGPQVDRIQLGPGEGQDRSRDLPLVLDDDTVEAGAGNEAEAIIGDVNTGHIELDASLHDTSAISDLLAPTESIDLSCPWYDVEEGCYIEEPAAGLGSHEQHTIPSAPARAQPQTVLQSSTTQQDQTYQQGVGSITRSTSTESALYSLPSPSDSGDGGWTDKNMAELEKDLGLALGEHPVESSSVGTLTSQSPRSAEAPQDETQSRKRTETTDSRPEDLQGTSQTGTAQGLEKRAQRKTEVVVVEREAVAMQQQEELVAKVELRHRAVGGQQDLAKVFDVNDPKDKEAIESTSAAQPKIDEHLFRLRGVRARQLAGRQTKTTQYRIVWGKYLDRSGHWFNEDDVQISMPCEPYSQDLASQIDIVRVREMRSGLRKGRKVFECLVDVFGLDGHTWTAEDQLRISLSPSLVAELKASSHPLSEAQREVLLRHSIAPIGDECRQASRPSRSSAPADMALGSKPATLKRGHQDIRTEISGETYHSANIDNKQSAYDSSDEDPRPAKRRKPRAAPAVTPTTSREHTPQLHVGKPGPVVAFSTATPGLDDAQPQFDHEYPSTFVDNSCQHASRLSRSPSVASEAVPAAEYQEWPFQGFLKRVTIGNKTTFNLEFQLSNVPEHFHFPVLSEPLSTRFNKETPTRATIPRNLVARSEMQPATLQSERKRVPWTPEEDETIRKMKEDGCSWEQIHRELPDRTLGAIQVHYSTKLKR